MNNDIPSQKSEEFLMQGNHSCLLHFETADWPQSQITNQQKGNDGPSRFSRLLFVIFYASAEAVKQKDCLYTELDKFHTNADHWKDGDHSKFFKSRCGRNEQEEKIDISAG